MVTAIAALCLVPAGLPTLRVVGKNLVDPGGKVVSLKGCNLGNWLVIEPWMLCLADQGEKSVDDQYQIREILTERFGGEQAEKLLDLYRSKWITGKDFKTIKSFGFNVVRLPIDYRLLEDDEDPYRLRRDAWQWIDKCISMAKAEGIYTILDMHGAQGGQSVYDHTGRSGQNKLWTDKEAQKRLAWLWGELAFKYRNEPAVVAYDVFNEPYGGPKPGIKQVFDLAYKAIRKNDKEKLVYAMGFYDGYDFYGDPVKNGWHNVAFQMHYYPGMFGNGEPTLLTHAKHLAGLSAVAADIDRLNVPFLVGEMNVVFDKAGGADTMRQTFDLHAMYGWATTIWSYKLFTPNGGLGEGSWGMVTNKNPFVAPNLRTASLKDIETFFGSVDKVPTIVNEKLRKALTDKNYKPKPLPAVPAPRLTAPDANNLPGFAKADIGGAKRGGLTVDRGRIELYGGGGDIWGQYDQFRFLYRAMKGNFTAEVQLLGLEDVHSYSKAGLMVRADTSPESACALVTVFPSGEIQPASRAKKGTDMAGGTAVQTGGFPVWLRLQRTGDGYVTSWSKDGKSWSEVARFDGLELGGSPLVGLVALSHDSNKLVKASMANFEVRSE